MATAHATLDFIRQVRGLEIFAHNYVQRYKDASPGEREALANIDTL